MKDYFKQTWEAWLVVLFMMGLALWLLFGALSTAKVL